MGPEAMGFNIRPLAEPDEFRAAEGLQEEVWGMASRNTTPAPVLIAVQRNGGLALGAFTPDETGRERLVGLAFGFAGRGADGVWKHCSHQLAVLPAARDRGLGERLKLAQRDHVLAQGLPLITWTYDPLESRNAHLNLHKLGGICRTYSRDYYGPMPDQLNTGLPSDRFQVEWWIAADHVARRLAGVRPVDGADVLPALPILNPALGSDDQSPARAVEASAAPQVLVRFPADSRSLRQQRPELALAWRLQLRAICEAAFAAGYAAIDLVRAGDDSFYLLEHGWRPA